MPSIQNPFKSIKKGICHIGGSWHALSFALQALLLAREQSKEKGKSNRSDLCHVRTRFPLISTKARRFVRYERRVKSWFAHVHGPNLTKPLFRVALVFQAKRAWSSRVKLANRSTTLGTTVVHRHATNSNHLINWLRHEDFRIDSRWFSFDADADRDYIAHELRVQLFLA